MRISDWSSDVCSSDLSSMVWLRSPTSATTASGRRWPAPACPSTSISGGQPDRPTMADFEVHIDLDGRTRTIGLARSNRVRGTETILFEYDDAWLEDPDRFSLEPALALTRGAFAPPAGLAPFR